jgi:hypothetical protein
MKVKNKLYAVICASGDNICSLDRDASLTTCSSPHIFADPDEAFGWKAHLDTERPQFVSPHREPAECGPHKVVEFVLTGEVK